MEEKLIVVSSDSHAGVPKELWSHYLPERYHELLPQLRRDNEIYPQAIYLLGAKTGSSSLPEHQEAHRDDWHGLHDPVLRLADMDREGVTAELIYHGDFRLGDMFHNVTGREYSFDAWADGARGWNRWAADNFGFAMHRFLVTAAIGPCIDMDATVAELEWMADHRFTGTYGPGYMWHRDMPPLFDEYWEPFWSTCEARGIAIVVHAGFGTEFGKAFPQIERIYNDVATASGSTDPAVMFEHADAVSEDSRTFFNDFLNHNVDSRRPMWQMMLGGVFDRHPDLKLLLTEIRLDWIPATLRHLDRVYEEHRADLPAKRKPSEYWPTNCLAGASFIHQAEVAMRHEIGVETILFGRDFPHPEGTWPNTVDVLRRSFHDVPVDDTAQLVGLTAAACYGMDMDALREIADRIGPTPEDLGQDPARRADPDEIANARWWTEEYGLSVL